MARTRSILRSAFTLGLLCMLIAAARSQESAPEPTRVDVRRAHQQLRESIEPQLAAAAAALTPDADLDAIVPRIELIFDHLVIHGRPDADADLFRRAAYLRRVGRQLLAIDEASRAPVLRYLTRHPELAGTLAFFVQPGRDDVREVYRVLAALARAHGERPGAFPGLTAALCVVHRGPEPIERKIAAHHAEAPTVESLFAFYTGHARRMALDPARTPPLLLAHVVDTTRPIAELAWALGEFSGRLRVGGRFFDVRHLEDRPRRGGDGDLKVTPLTLPNLAGGFGRTIEQAYYAAEIGKAIGVPTLLIHDPDGDSPHHRMAYLTRYADEAEASWNFRAGRYDASAGWPGVAPDPLSREEAPYGLLEPRPAILGVSADDRRTAVALLDAADRLAALPAPAGAALPPLPGLEVDPALLHRRAQSADGQLELLRAAARRAPGEPRPWQAIVARAQAGELNRQQIGLVLADLHRLAEAWPRFVLAASRPLIEALPDRGDRHEAWAALEQPLRRHRPALAAARLARARLLADAVRLDPDPDRRSVAFDAYDRIIQQHGNDGPYVIDALEEYVRLLPDDDELANRIVRPYQRAFRLLSPPDDDQPTVVRKATAYYQVGLKYAGHLHRAGQRSLGLEIAVDVTRAVDEQRTFRARIPPDAQ